MKRRSRDFSLKVDGSRARAYIYAVHAFKAFVHSDVSKVPAAKLYFQDILIGEKNAVEGFKVTGKLEVRMLNGCAALVNRKVDVWNRERENGRPVYFVNFIPVRRTYKNRWRKP